VRSGAWSHRERIDVRGSGRDDRAMARLDDLETVEPRDRAEWRAWLAEHHATSPGVWFVAPKVSTGRVTVPYEEMICEALCFGWVDGVLRRLDHERTMLHLSPRRRGSTWARTNKERIARLEAAGLMAPAGRAVVEAAKADGTWTSLDAVEALEVPADLAVALEADPIARAGYDAMPPSARKQVLWSVVSAKRPETRARRVARAVEAVRERRVP